MLAIPLARRIEIGVKAGLLATLGLVMWGAVFSVGLGSYAAHMQSARPFEHHHLLRPYSCAYRHVELHVVGRYEAGGDQVVGRSQITITLTTNDGQAHAKTLNYTGDGLFEGDETYVRVSATPEALAAWMTSLPIETDEVTLRAETEELSREISNACASCSVSWKSKHFFLVRP